jgi:hypothetical protein
VRGQASAFKYFGFGASTCLLKLLCVGIVFRLYFSATLICFDSERSSRKVNNGPMGWAMSYAIELTDEETVLLSDIELDAMQLDYEKLKRQEPHVLGLLKSLLDRGAIPQTRLRYWSDPNFQNGRVKASHKGLFERNGTVGQEIYTHPHFLDYLRYFLFGAQLPERVIAEFGVVVGNPNWVTSGDVTNITKGTRRIVREYGLQTEHEEFYRLALDMGLSLSFAQSVRDAVKRVK